MEIKDLLSSIGLPIAALTISGISLYISFQNRRNAIREHLYKEQILFFTSLLEQTSKIGFHFEDVQLNKTISEGIDNLIQKEIYDLDKLLDKYIIIVPDEKMYNLIHLVIMNAYRVSTVLIAKKGLVNNKDLEPFDDSHYKLIDELRDYIGVETLSKENLSLYAKKIKNEASETRQKLPPKV